MKCNVGGIDRLARIVIGAALLLASFVVPMDTVWRTVAIVVGAIALITGLVRFCPANALLGIDSSGKKS